MRHAYKSIFLSKFAYTETITEEMRHYSFIISLICLIWTYGCQGGKTDLALIEQRDAVAALVGKKIIIPKGLICQIQDTPIKYEMKSADYKIIVYIDSTECTSCRMKLPIWNEIINEFKSIKDVNVDFLMILNSGVDKEIDFILKRDNFLHPIIKDEIGKYATINSLPEGDVYHTYLLDHENKIVAVGNPATNPKVRKLYKQIIGGEKNVLAQNSGLCARPVIPFGVANPGDTVIKYFSLYNSKNMSFTIQELIPSCDCTVASITTDTINSGDNAIVKMSLVLDSVSGFINQYVDIFYNEKENPERLTLYGFINKP